MKRVILVFLKYPEVGRVKTRLAAGIGEENAVEAYHQMVCRVLEQCRIASPDKIVIAYDPAERFGEISEWLSPWLAAFPGELTWLAQNGGDLGDRLHEAAEKLLEKSPGAGVAIIGTDCIHLDRNLFAETWSHLEKDTDAVYGPTEDGGYYLLGIRRAHCELFYDIPWSSENTLETSLSNAASAGLKTRLLAPRIDVDTVEEWNQVKAGVSGRPCLFFDRDGVVNRTPGPGYVTREEDFHLNPGIAEALAWLKARDWLAILVTSQKGVGKGLMSGSDLDRIHRKMQRELATSGAAFDGIYAFTGEPDCPHQPKPDPEMIRTAAERFFIDPRLSWMIGDADRDIEMGKAAGLAGTIRIRGEKVIGVAADCTLDETTEIADTFERIL
ncbi:MAG: TIGR04282 family arsenosugar biosynthesis glycosyltransferase [Verrucomicrobiales bacterium]|nr:TIGR04282 family arsenosugar biosynthesis glycosyltransferase [Verrucomicrobiales bacterium]